MSIPHNNPSANPTRRRLLGQILRLPLRGRSGFKRRGSVLILVIALLVLLALIGTAYLSSVQTERYTSDQHKINVEADLLIAGMSSSLQGQISAGVWGNTVNGLQYRPAYQEMPTNTAANSLTAPPSNILPQGAYYSYDAVGTNQQPAPKFDGTDADPCDLWLADRLPSLDSGNNPIWGNISWPLFKDTSGEYTFDSPLNGSQPLHLGQGIRKGTLRFQPGSTGLPDGSTGPAMTIVTSGYTNPDGSSLPNMPGGSTTLYAASASGEGVADSMFTKVPVGQIDGITYYVAIRVVDGNSAINISSAESQTADAPFNATQVGANNLQAPYYGIGTNFGFFPSNVGFQELLDQAPPSGGNNPAALNEANALDYYRTGSGFYSLFYPTNFTSTIAGPTLAPTPIPDAGYTNNSADSNTQANTNPPLNFAYYSNGDVLQTMLTGRYGNPGYVQSTSGTFRCNWLGLNEAAGLAYKFSLYNPNVPATITEQLVPNELRYYARSSPYAPTQVGGPNQPGSWYFDLYHNFNFNSYAGSNTSIGVTPGAPIRSIVTTENAVTNAISSRLGNTSSPAQWRAPGGTNPAAITYNFGDWVIDGGRSFVCIQQHTITTGGTGTHEPGLVDPTTGITGVNPQAVGYWAGALEIAPYSNTSTKSASTPYPGMPFINHPVKTSINTGTFEQLWLAFAQVMTDSIGPDPGTLGGSPQWQPPMLPVATGSTEPQLPMFRSVLRDPNATLKLSSSQMLKLRAALAAVNTIDLRGGKDATIAGKNTVSSRRITLTDSLGNPQYFVEIFGNRPQVFISEMVAELADPSGGAAGGGGGVGGGGGGGGATNFIAIELVNPYPQPMVLKNWQFCTIDRSTFGTANGMTMSAPLLMDPTTPVITVPAATITGGVVTPGIAVVASAATAPQTGPPPITMPVTNLFVCPTLANAIGKELVLVRPRVYDTTTTNPKSTAFDPTAPGADNYQEDPATAAGCAEMVPVDQLDLSGADQLATALKLQTSNYPVRLQYRRGSTPPTNSTSSSFPTYSWNFVYPGVYNASNSATTNFLHMDGIVVETKKNLGPGNLGAPDSGPPTKVAPTNITTTFDTAPIQLANTFAAGANNLDPSAQKNLFPFGQFARNGDMLQVPFIGSYRIRTPNQPTGNFVEWNAITMDSALANDNEANFLTATNSPAAVNASKLTGTSQIYFEQIGRFCPVGYPDGNSDAEKMDFSTNPTNWHYHWAEKIFNYLTVRSPQDDYYPNVDPAASSIYTTPPSSVSPPSDPRYPQVITNPGTAPVPVANYDPTVSNAIAAGKSEDTVGVQGLININTAPAVVLAQLPFYGAYTSTGVPMTAAQQAAANAGLAHDIVVDRTANGPFKSIFDLYRVKSFRTVNDNYLAGGEPGPINGVFSPGGMPLPTGTPPPGGAYTTSGVRLDFRERFLLLNNISNLITTRSDTFTCYILLQGWRNVGTTPTLAVQRRAAFIIQRTNITPNNSTPVVFNIPTE